MSRDTLHVPPAVAPPGLPPDLPDGEVHVWLASLDEADPCPGLELLSDDERRRADRFHGPRLAARFVRSRKLLRHLLGSYVGRDGETLRFAAGPEGKPRLAEPADAVCFNLSHSGPLWALAVAPERAVGIDVERMSRRLDREGIARRMFAAGECEVLRGLPSDRQAAAFFRGWAAREAIVKAMGVGMFSLAVPFEVDLDPGCPLVVRAAPPGFPWRVGPIPVGRGAVGALATRGEPDRIRSWAVPARAGVSRR